MGIKNKLTLSAVFFGFSLLSVSAAEDRPNILFLMADDHALEAIGAYNRLLKDYVHTPTIDRLSSDGMRFTNVCCNNSICSPSRASIISGQYSHVNGGLTLGCTLKPDSPSYIVELQRSGYTTAVVGKWHMGQWPRGCDDYAVTKGQGKYFNPTFNRPGGGTEKHKGYYADVYMDWALEWLKKRDRTRPFYLGVHFKGPHAPFDYPERWAHLHEGQDIPEPANLHEDVAKASPLLKGLHYSMLFNEIAPKIYHLKKLEGRTAREKRSEAYQHMLHKYIRCVAAIDDNVKRVLDYLEGEGTKDNTIIIYTSDQGYWLGQHGMFDKRLILEETLKMPLIVRFPGKIEAGTLCHELAMNIDFGPTMLDFAGIRAPTAMQGASLRPLLQGTTPPDWREGIFYAYYARAPLHWGIRTKHHKLIHFPKTNEFEFYDLQRDQFEMNDLSKDKSYAPIIQATEKQLRALMEGVGITKEFLAREMNRRTTPAPGSGNRKRSKKGTRTAKN